jgi:hypothetical protein
MTRYFPSWTHIIIRTLSAEEIEKSNVYAYMDICFGPGNDNAITNIRWKKSGAGSIVLPPITHVVKEGFRKDNGELERKTVPVLTGAVAEEVSELCLKAIARLKDTPDFKLRPGHTYKVTEKNVTILEDKHKDEYKY